MKFSLLLTCLILSLPLSSQVRTPPLSQKQKVSQKVGFTEVTIEYCRPLMRGRKIFGEMEEYGKVWRTGANRNTQVSFDKNVTIGNQELQAATYTLFTRPGKEQWDIYFYPYDNGYGVPEDFSEENAIATIQVPVFELNRSFENLTLGLENVTENTADLTIIWERTYIAIPILFTTESEIMGKVENLVDSHSSDYYMAAKYYLDNNKDLEKAKAYIQQSIDLRDEPDGTPKFWIYQLQAEILLANNEKSAALKSAEKAMIMAESRGPDDFYVKQIKALLEKLR